MAGILAWSSTATVPDRWALRLGRRVWAINKPRQVSSRATRASRSYGRGLITATTANCSVASPDRPRLGALLSCVGQGSVKVAIRPIRPRPRVTSQHHIAALIQVGEAESSRRYTRTFGAYPDYDGALVCWIWMVRGEGNGTTER